MKLNGRTMCSKFALEIHKCFKIKRKKRPSLCFILILLNCFCYFVISPQQLARRVLANALNGRDEASSQDTNGQDQDQSCYYYASFSKWPLICGSRLQVNLDEQKVPSISSNNKINNSSSERHLNQNNLNHQMSHYVASFEAIPYAAPPLGVLRFMPPGAPSPSSSSSKNSPRPYELMPGGKISHIQEHTRPGLNCIRLANWLQPADLPTQQKPPLPPPSRPLESEDCLHLSIYVPVSGNNEQLRKSSASQLFNVSGGKIPGKLAQIKLESNI